MKLLSFIKEERTHEALEYIRSAPRFKEALASSPDLRKGVTLLAFPRGAPSVYDGLLERKWRTLAEQLVRLNAIVHGMAERPIVEPLLLAGLSALKCGPCDASLSPSCPTCDSRFKSLLLKIPRTHHSRSRIICPITGQPADEGDLPRVSPAGFVYSSSSLEALHDLSTDGLVLVSAAAAPRVCPAGLSQRIAVREGRRCLSASQVSEALRYLISRQRNRVLADFNDFDVLAFRAKVVLIFRMWEALVSEKFREQLLALPPDDRRVLADKLL